MIAGSDLADWRKQAPWPLDAQVEQDLILSRALVEIYSDPLLKSQLAFRGGTALHKLFFTPAARYSEDLDFVQIEPGPIGPAMTALRKRLEPWLGKTKWKQGEFLVTFYYQVETDLEPKTRLRIKIEINTREHKSVYGVKLYPYTVTNSWFQGNASLLSYELEELLGTKLRALYQRKKGRDLFDLAYALEHNPKLDPDKVITCFLHYGEQAGNKIFKEEFEENLEAKAEDPEFGSDISALLASEDSLTTRMSFDVQKAIETVQDTLVSRLPARNKVLHKK